MDPQLDSLDLRLKKYWKSEIIERENTPVHAPGTQTWLMVCSPIVQQKSAYSPFVSCFFFLSLITDVDLRGDLDSKSAEI